MKKALFILVLVAILLLNSEAVAQAPTNATQNPKGQQVSTEQAYSDEDLYWLSHIVSAEAKGEPFEGKLAVANVVLNRVDSENWPKTIKDVVFDRAGGIQFQPVANGSIFDEPTEESIEAARQALEGRRVVGQDAVYFYNPKTATDRWIRSLPVLTQIGNHVFAKGA